MSVLKAMYILLLGLYIGEDISLEKFKEVKQKLFLDKMKNR